MYGTDMAAAHGMGSWGWTGWLPMGFHAVVSWLVLILLVWAAVTVITRLTHPQRPRTPRHPLARKWREDRR